MQLIKSIGICCLILAARIGLEAQTPSTNDLWDVSQGATVVSNSPLDIAFGDPMSYDAANVFGARTGTVPEAQLGNVVFTDDEPAGFVHFVEWRTTNQVTVRSFRLFATGEDAGLREFAEFRLLAKTNGATAFDQVLYEFTPSHPYTYADYDNGLLLASNVKPTTAQEFRAEFINLAGTPSYYNGPRILELDGFSEPLLIEASIRVSQVEICWETSLGFIYQVEYRDTLIGGGWQALGGTTIGNGSKMCVTDLITSSSQNRYYRIRTLLE